ncbi:hypothetical protein ACRAWF_22530 [Streptomyces sp. L7]
MTGDPGHDVEKARRDIVDFDRNGSSAQTLASSTGLQLLTKYHSLGGNDQRHPETGPGAGGGGPRVAGHRTARGPVREMTRPKSRPTICQRVLGHPHIRPRPWPRRG